MSGNTLNVYGDGQYQPEGTINRLAIYGLDHPIKIEGATAAFRENSKVFDAEGVKLSLLSDSELSWE